MQERIPIWRFTTMGTQHVDTLMGTSTIIILVITHLCVLTRIPYSFWNITKAYSNKCTKCSNTRRVVELIEHKHLKAKVMAFVLVKLGLCVAKC